MVELSIERVGRIESFVRSFDRGSKKKRKNIKKKKTVISQQ